MRRARLPDRGVSQTHDVCWPRRAIADGPPRGVLSATVWFVFSNVPFSHVQLSHVQLNTIQVYVLYVCERENEKREKQSLSLVIHIAIFSTIGIGTKCG